MDRFEKQFAEEEFHEYHSKTYFILIKKQFETFLYPKSLYSYSQTTEFERQVKIFQDYSRQKTEHYQSVLIYYLDELENVIVDITHREEELRITEKDVKDKQAKLETKKQEIMILKSECSSPGDNSDAKNEKQAKEKCLTRFRLLYTHLEFLSSIDSENTCSSGGCQRAFGLFFGEKVEYFAPRMFFNLDKLEKQLNNQEFDEEASMVIFKVFKNQFQQFITKQISMDYDDSLANRFFTDYTLSHNSKVNERTMQTREGMVNMVKDKCDDGLVVTESSRTKLEKQDESSRSGNDTLAEGADIILSNEPESINEVQSTAAYNVFANDRQHVEQPKFINEGKVDQDAEQCLDKRPLLASVIENQKTESLNQPLESENDCLKKTITQFQKDFSKLEAQSSKVETNECNEVKVKVNFDEIETKNIELEHQVASLIKENEHLKLVYNFFYSIKKPRVQKENVRSTLSEFAIDHILGKDDSSPSSITKSNISKLEKESGENICENAKCELQTKIVELEKVLTQKTKDFDNVKLELSNRTAKFEAYFEKLKNTKVVLERQLARKVDDSKAEKDQFLKEINHLRTQLENLKGKSVETKFDKPLILGKPPSDKLLINSQISKSWFTPKVVVQKDLSKPVTAQSLSKNEKDQLLK
ncbi:hypothetical protein Tco_0133421 [Tanacetum coccineum]